MSYIYLKEGIDHFSIALNDVGKITSQTQNNEVEIQFLNANITITVTHDVIEKFDIAKTGDRHSHKVCDRCFKRLPTEDFPNNRIKKNNVITKRPSCKGCRKIKDGKSISTTDRTKWEKRRPKDYSSFTCPICDKTTIVKISKVVLDHNHHTGEVRGYLCESCNTGIGRFDDNPNIAKKAIEWLEKN